MGFEKDAQLAFRLDIELGFRTQPEMSWTARPFDELPQRRRDGHRARAVSVEDIVDARYHAPETWIEPADEPGRVRITSTSQLVVQEFGDLVPRQEGTTTEVPYGSVVRAGPVLLAPLDGDQSDALVAGTLELPMVGEGRHDEERISLFDGEVLKTRRALARRRAIVLAATVVLLAAGSVVGIIGWRYANRSQIRPERVAVEFDGLAKSIHHDLEEPLRQRLERYGFEPVFFVGRKPSALLESAGQILRLEIGWEQSQRAGRGRGQAPLHLFRVNLDVADTEQYLRRRSTIAAAGGPNAEQSLVDATGDFLDAQMPWAVATLAKGVTPEDLAGFSSRMTKRRRLFEKTWRLTKNHQRAERNETRRCATPSADSSEDGSFEQITDRCRWERLIGVTPEGKAIVINETKETFFTIGSPPKRGNIATPHRIEVVDLETRERTTLASAHRYRPIAGLSGDGTRVFVIEVERDRSVLVDLEVATGTQQVLTTLEQSVTGLVKASPRGRYVALTLTNKVRPSCFNTHFSIIDVGYPTAMIIDRETKRSARVDLESVSHMYWLDRVEVEGEVHEPALIVTTAVVEGTEHPQSEVYEGIALVDPRTGQVLRRFRQDHWRMIEIAGVLDGELVFSICANHYYACRGLVRGFDIRGSAPATCALGRLNLERCVVREEPLKRCLGERPMLVGGHVLYDAATIQALELETRTVREVSRLQHYVNLRVGPDGSAYFTKNRELDDAVRLEIGRQESSNVPGIYRLDLGALQEPQ